MHCTTFSHQAAVERFNRDPTKHKASASTEFLEGFCAVLRGFAARQKSKLSGQRGFKDEWVDANLVYQEYIRDRHHTHLSATRWKSVAGFVRFLGQKGMAEVKQKKPVTDSLEESEYLYIVPEQEEDGSSSSEDEQEQEEQSSSYERDPTKRPKWFIKLIDKSPEAILAAKNKNLQQRQSNEDQNLQVKQLEAVQKQAQLAASKNTAPVVLVQKKQAAETSKITSAAALFNQSDSEEEEKRELPANEKRKHLAVLDELQTEESKIKRAFIPYETGPIIIEDEPEEIPWIRKGLLIRIKNAEVANGKYAGMLAVIDAVIEDFGAQVSVLKSGDQLLLDQDDCAPVAEVLDDEYDDQLGSLDSKITANAVKSNRCIILALNYIGREGRLIGKRADTGRFQVELTEAGSSHIHRLKLELNAQEFCIFFE